MTEFSRRLRESPAFLLRDRGAVSSGFRASRGASRADGMRSDRCRTGTGWRGSAAGTRDHRSGARHTRRPFRRCGSNPRRPPVRPRRRRERGSLARSRRPNDRRGQWSARCRASVRRRPEKSFPVRMKWPICAMSWFFLLQVVRRRAGCQRVAAHHWKRPSPASSVNTGSARPMTEPRGNGPK
jgi:hypothetical protein